MRQLLLAGLLAAGASTCAMAAAPDWKAQPAPRVTGQLDLTALADSGCRVLEAFTGETDGSPWGVLGTREVTLPDYSRGLFLAHATKAKAWPNMRNQAYPHVVTNDRKSLAGLHDGVVFFLLELKAGGYLAVAALPGPRTESWLHTDPDGRLLLSFGTFGTAGVERCAVPLFAWARSADLYAACHRACTAALAGTPIGDWTRVRSQKPYPEYFAHLGWCSWEHFKTKIDETNMLQSLDEIEASGLPIRYAIVDMGHTSAQGGGLTTFKPAPEKFPNAWAPLLKRRTADRITWMGLWHFFQGAQDGICPENDFGPELQRHFSRPKTRKTLTSGGDPASALAFYRAFMGSVKAYGFDFVKVDFQSAQLSHLAGRVDNAAQMCVNNAQGFEQALHELGLGLINCNWHNPLNVFNCRHSNVGRCSMDYVANSAFSARRHLFQSYANTLWLGQLAWPDHDMFHSSDRMAGRMMAVSKAVSGGPVYLSDAPSQLVRETILPLCAQDGRLLRPLAPAAPLPDSVFADPFGTDTPYRVIAPLPNRSACLVVCNLRQKGDEDVTLTARVRPEDYVQAGGMMQPYAGPWTLPAEGVVLYDGYAGKGWKLDTEHAFELKGLSDRLLQLSPIQDGWALIGRTDKYLSAAAVELISVREQELRFRMPESGPLAVWSARGAPKAPGLAFEDAGNGLYRATLPVGGKDREIVVSR